MTTGIASFQTLFQTYYPEKDLTYLIPDNLPLLNMIAKADDLQGDVTDLPYLYGTPQGFSYDFNKAAGQAGASPRALRASVRASQAYSFLEWFDKDEILSQGASAYADMFQKLVQGKMEEFYKNIDADLHGSATGWRGTVAAIPGGQSPVDGSTVPANTVVLGSQFALEVLFEQDMLVNFTNYTGFPLSGSIFPPSDGRLPSSQSSDVQVIQVDPVAQTITVSDASAATVGSFVTLSGASLGFSSANLNGGLIGLDSMNPYGGVVAGENFCGIDRSVYKTRLAGYYFDGSQLSIEDALKRLSMRMSQGGARASKVALMNPMDMDALDSKLATFAKAYSTWDTANYGFDTIEINGGAGRLSVVLDPHMARGFSRIIDPSVIKLRHKNALPHMVEVSGRTQEQAVNFDGRTARLRAYMQAFCEDPRKLGIVKLPQVLVG